MSGAPQDEMRCGELGEAITDYLEDAMPVRDRLRFEAHLEGCPNCFSQLERMREAIAALGELRKESMDPRVRDDLLAAFRAWRRM